MRFVYSKQFLRSYGKLPQSLRKQTNERILLWQSQPFHSQLRNHALKGKYKDYKSINITGDVRLLFRQENDLVIFELIGTHSQLYK